LKEIELGGIYGGWLLKDRIIPVDYEAHETVAIYILKELFTINERKRIYNFCKKYSVYRVMMRLGFIRLQYNSYSGKVEMEKSKYHKPNLFQERIISRAAFCDELEIYYERPFQRQRISN
jgi:hypothetical protein